MAACAMEADGDGRMSRGGDGPHHERHEYTNTPKDVYKYTHTHTYRCAEGADDDGAVWGGSMAPINGLITGHPQWHALPAGKKSR